MPPAQRLVLLAIDSPEADVTGYEPVRRGDRRVGYVTSGSYGHHVRQSLALAYLDVDALEADAPLGVDVIGTSRPARWLREPPYDPAATLLRS
ncbi:MAG: glycine cleavage T C-terminal barrel domain-containing protein [Steroidobacteraceae bacterium]